ncbi:uncharacterized protein BN776_01085 [Clostridium sp. CAG:768]|uniref:lysophospholipid acyltransferase family protein n=1 Tax=Candidatus Stercorousia sp. TaxID=3048886 RepID=UPI000340A6CF|nr:uncharacterized protein BN776_01085 [Clostridium sp. CAG:768]
MVRLINDSNIDFLANTAYRLMRLQEIFTHIHEYNNPNLKPCIYAMWHANQFLVHGLEDKANTSILVSNSIDGEVVARAVEKWGFKVVRGSAGKKGAVESTMQMLTRLKNGECVGIMVDGPHGPLHKVKNGAVKLAQMSGAPIVPAHWYSPQKTFINLPSWDKMKTPLGDCKILNLYGEPIYVNENATDEELSEAKENIRTQLLNLEAKAPEIYNEAKKQKLWNKKN